MKYTIRAGALYRACDEEAVCRIRGLISEEKRIEDASGALCLNVSLMREKGGDVRLHRYVMRDPMGCEVASATPGYAKGEAPEEAGWPLHRMLRADRAALSWQGQRYALKMCGPESYVLRDCFDQEAACLSHRGLAGGWDLTAKDAFSPAFLCGLFVFCRYLERENEMLLL